MLFMHTRSRRAGAGAGAVALSALLLAGSAVHAQEAEEEGNDHVIWHSGLTVRCLCPGCSWSGPGQFPGHLFLPPLYTLY